MKQVYFLVLIMIFLQIGNAYSQKKVNINKINYNVTENRIFLKDYRLMANFKQYLSDKGMFQFGFLVESKRNDSLFISGNMKILGRKIICSEKYFFNYFEKDSIVRVFKQYEDGRIKLESYEEYKNGVQILKNK